MDLTFECPICLEEINNAVIGSCTHHFCYYCLYRHCHKSLNCPICKTVIREIRNDFQFQNLVNERNNISFKKEFDEDLYILKTKFINQIKNSSTIILQNKDKKYSTCGISLKNNTDSTGVKIVSIKKNSLFFDKFKKDDILLFINKVPCINYKSVISQINYLMNNNLEIIVNKL